MVIYLDDLKQANPITISWFQQLWNQEASKNPQARKFVQETFNIDLKNKMENLMHIVNSRRFF